MKTKNKRNYTRENGITLIALVVTIVVLLILAGVSVNALFGNSGIIEKAKEAQNAMDKAKENDEKELNLLNNWIENVTRDNEEIITVTLNMNNGGKFLTFEEKDGMVNYTEATIFEIRAAKGSKVVFPTRVTSRITTMQWPRTIQDIRENGLAGTGAYTGKIPFTAYTGAVEDGFAESPNAQLGEGKKEIIVTKDITLYYVND